MTDLILKPCKIFPSDRVHMNTCHNDYQNCWKRALTKAALKEFLKKSLAAYVVKNLEILETIND